MSKETARPFSNYPRRTKGSKWAEENRKKASLLSDEERAELFRSGLVRLYAKGKKEPVRS